MEMVSPLYGLWNSNHDFYKSKSWGKNIFTNAFPVAVAQYEAIVMGLDPILIKASKEPNGNVATVQCPSPWTDILDADPHSAQFLFETAFDPYRRYTRGEPNKSDVTVADAAGGHRRALEVKLTAVPDSASYNRTRAEQSAEIVARPLMIEQLAVSIAHSFGPGGVKALRETIQQSDRLPHPQQARWSDEAWMITKMPAILAVIEDVIVNGIGSQTPMVLNVVWRTVGRTPELEDNCFETFVWTDMAFTALFLNSARSLKNQITRPQRALIWIVKMLWDYASQGRVDAIDTTDLAYGLQTDKAGSFAGPATYPFLCGEYLNKPRIPSSAVGKIIHPNYRDFLAPERRLDAALFIESYINKRDGNDDGGDSVSVERP